MTGNAISAIGTIRSGSSQAQRPKTVNASTLQKLPKPIEATSTHEFSPFDVFVSSLFLQSTAATNISNPITVHEDRVHIDDKRIELEKPYSITYGKNTFIIRKTLDDKIHVYKLS